MPPGKLPLNGESFDVGDDNQQNVFGNVANLAEKNFVKLKAESTHDYNAPDQKKSIYTILSEEDDEDDENRLHTNDVLRSEEGLDSAAESNISGRKDEDSDSTDEFNAEVSVDEKSSTKERLFILLAQAGPVTVSFFLGFAGTFTNLVFASHFISEDGSKSVVFAGISLANTFANVSCMSLLIGMSSALETLGSQLNGAKEYRQVGVSLWKCIIILGFMLPFIGTIWYYTGDIFKAIGIEDNVCLVIQRYIRIRSLTLPIDVINISFEKYLMSIGVVKPSMWSNISFNVSLLLLNYYFVQVLRLDYTCLAYSWVISSYIMAAVQWSLSWNHPSVQRTLQPWSNDALKGWGQFISLGVPGTLMLCSEWWAYEVLSLMASFKGTTALAAQAIILQTASLVFMVPLGLGVASASLVGNAIGAKKRALAIQLGWLAIFVIVVLESGVAAGIYFFGIHFVEFFTTDEAVRGLAEESLTFLSVFCFFDAIQGVISGILRGAGKQMIGAAANIIAFYVIGLPLAYYFCFKTSFGINGLMLGLSGGVIFQDIVSLVLITCYESFVFPADSSLVNPALSQSQHGLVSDTDDLEDMDSKSGSQFMSNNGDAGYEMLSPA